MFLEIILKKKKKGSQVVLLLSESTRDGDEGIISYGS